MILASCHNFSSRPATLPRELGQASDLAREWRDLILSDGFGRIPPCLLEAAETASRLPAHAIALEVGDSIFFVDGTDALTNGFCDATQGLGASEN
jgi:hypothetical protein